MKTYGDGNCLPRSMSILVYGNQNHFMDMRARLVVEGVLHKAHYLDSTYLEQGAQNTYGRATLPEIFAQYSSQYYDCVLTPTVVEEIYESEILNMAKNGSYCGVWQIAQAASVFNCNIHSHYPQLGNMNVSKDASRLFYPVDGISSKTVDILWTRMGKQSGSPNHFVPLLQMKSSEELITARAIRDQLRTLQDEVEAQTNVTAAVTIDLTTSSSIEPQDVSETQVEADPNIDLIIELDSVEVVELPVEGLPSSPSVEPQEADLPPGLTITPSSSGVSDTSTSTEDQRNPVEHSDVEAAVAKQDPSGSVGTPTVQADIPPDLTITLSSSGVSDIHTSTEDQRNPVEPSDDVQAVVPLQDPSGTMFTPTIQADIPPGLTITPSSSGVSDIPTNTEDQRNPVEPSDVEAAVAKQDPSGIVGTPTAQADVPPGLMITPSSSGVSDISPDTGGPRESTTKKYIKVKLGNFCIPAVIVEETDQGVWVNFCKKTKSRQHADWTQMDVMHFVDETFASLCPPQVIKKGARRKLYRWNEDAFD